MMAFTMVRREPPEMLRYLARKLREGVNPEQVAITLELLADELDGPDPRVGQVTS